MPGTLGVLVAGGAGARLAARSGDRAARPKAQVILGGISLLERAAGTLAGVCDDLVVAAPASRVPRLPEAIRTRAGRAPRRVDDHLGSPGPLAGIVAGLQGGPGAIACDRALVLGVDFPFMEGEFLAALLEGLDGYHAVVPAPGGTLQPLAAAFAPAAAAILAACHAGGEGAPSRALRSLTVRRLDDDALARMPGGAACLFNVNTPDDLSEAERRIAMRASR